MSDDLCTPPSEAKRFWLPLAQAIAIGAGVIIAWRSFGPASSPVTPDVVAGATGGAARGRHRLGARHTE